MSKNFSAKDGDGNLVSGGVANFDGSVVVAVDGSLTPIATDFTASDPTANTAGASNSLYSTPYLLRWIVKGLQAIFGRLPAQLDANGNLKTAAQVLVFDGSAFQFRRQAVTGSITSLVGMTNVVPLARYNATLPTLADGDHRALQVDINGNLRTAAQGLVITTCTRSSAAVTSTSSTVLAANANRKSAVLSNAGNVDIFLSRGATAAGGQGILLKANGGNYEITPLTLYAGVLSAATASGTSSLAIEEGV